MGEAWYEGVPDEALKTEADKAYEQAALAIREGLGRGLGFDEACAGIAAADEDLRTAIIADMLKVIIAEEHFTGSVPLEDLARRLKLDIGRLEAAKEAMLREVEESAVREYRSGLPEGDHGRTFH